MHTKSMAESDGKFTKRHKSTMSCPKCNKKSVVYEVWESSCGAYEDYKYTCLSCKCKWWVDGPDS